MTNCFFD